MRKDFAQVLVAWIYISRPRHRRFRFLDIERAGLWDNAKSEVEKAITAITLSPLRLLQIQVQTRYKYRNIKKLSDIFRRRAQTFIRDYYFLSVAG